MRSTSSTIKLVNNKSATLGIVLVVLLYVFWMWNVLAEPPFADIHEWSKTNFSRSSIEFEDIIEGGPGKDGIPSIDNPKFETVLQAQSWLDSREPVVAFVYAGEARAYPLQILMYHEIVNDEVIDQSIAVTYCPLCNAAMVFSRLHNNDVLEFGVSGKVYSSNLVMYDRQTESWWLQFTGEAIVGSNTGVKLDLLPSQIVSFAQFKTAYPHGKVLTRYTGTNKKYGVNPYAHYDSRQMPVVWFYRKPFDNRLPAMERVLGVAIENHAYAFPLSSLSESALVQTQVASMPIVIISKKGMASAVDKPLIKDSKDVLAAVAFLRNLNGKLLDFEIRNNDVVDMQTGSIWNIFGEAIEGELKGERLQRVDRGVYFSFVWLDFYPRSVIDTGETKSELISIEK